VAVVHDPPTLTDHQLATITLELRHFETIFVDSGPDPAELQARVFDLAGELPFAGHPVLGAAAVQHMSEHAGPRRRDWRVHLAARTVSVETVRIAAAVQFARSAGSRPTADLLAAFDESMLRGLVSWVLVAGFIAPNVRGSTVAVRAWLAVLLAGATMNGLVMVLNAGMPFSPRGARLAGFSEDVVATPLPGHPPTSPDTVLPYLADVIPVPVVRQLMSVGDIVMVAGVTGFLVAVVLAARPAPAITGTTLEPPSDAGRGRLPVGAGPGATKRVLRWLGGALASWASRYETDNSAQGRGSEGEGCLRSLLLVDQNERHHSEYEDRSGQRTDDQVPKALASLSIGRTKQVIGELLPLFGRQGLYDAFGGCLLLLGGVQALYHGGG
jgi:hypothetical protein